MPRYSFLALGLAALFLDACSADEAGSAPTEVTSATPGTGAPGTSAAGGTEAVTTPGAGSQQPAVGASPGVQGSTGMPATVSPMPADVATGGTTAPAEPPVPAVPGNEPVQAGSGGAAPQPVDLPSEEPVAGGAGGAAEPAVPSDGVGGMMAAGGMPGMDSPGATLDPAAVILEDDFDAATGFPDTAKWEEYEQWAQDQGIAPVIDSSKSHSAPNSVRATSSNVGLGSFLVPVTGLPVDGNSFYVRVFINWENATSSITGHSGFLVGATARDNSGTELRLGISNKGPGDEAMMDLNLIGGEGGEVTRYSNGFTDGGNPADFTGAGFQFEADTWYCLEAYFGGGTASEFRVWVDGAELADMHVTDFQGSEGGAARTSWAPSYTVLKIGAQDYDANLGSIWYDDVVIATQPVGCE